MIDCFNFSCAEKDEYLSLDQIVEYSFTCKADFFANQGRSDGGKPGVALYHRAKGSGCNKNYLDLGSA